MEKYPLSLRILHWLIALLIIGLLIVGLIMTHLSKDDAHRDALYGLHKSLGITVLALASIRLALKLGLHTPALPQIIPKAEQLLAHAGHAALYAFTFLMPITGITLSMFYGRPVKWFGLALPRLMSIDKERGHWAADLHFYTALALAAMITLHAGAVLLHYRKHRVNLLKRMA